MAEIRTKDENGNIVLINTTPATKQLRARRITRKQADKYMEIVKSAHGFGVKKDNIFGFGLGLMNVMFPDINTSDSEYLYTAIDALFKEVS